MSTSGNGEDGFRRAAIVVMIHWRNTMTPVEHRLPPAVFTTMPSPLGPLTLVATDRGLAAVLMETERPGRVPVRLDRRVPSHPWLVAAERQLVDYFAGRRTAFDLPLDVTGTPFQLSVWAALRTIPFGETRSYAQIAGQIGRPRAVRAVGAANGRNPLSIVTPCHRVIGAGGALTGYAGGVDAKRFLLDHERHPR
jgi:methylated-DNA-[protein]-cysteine S-methyltransferase